MRFPHSEQECSMRFVPRNGTGLQATGPVSTHSFSSGGSVCLRLRASNEHPSEVCAFCEHGRQTDLPRSSLSYALREHGDQP